MKAHKLIEGAEGGIKCIERECVHLSAHQSIDLKQVKTGLLTRALETDSGLFKLLFILSSNFQFVIRFDF